MNLYPNSNLLAKFLEIFKGVKLQSILDGTGKTLGIINQAIPIYHQIKPIASNWKTIIKIADNLKDDNSNSKDVTNNKVDIKKEENTNSSNNGPIFYI